MVNEAFNALYETIVKLRSPEGCPWDREQTPQTLRTALLEETYECIEAIEEEDSDHIKEELGDIFLVAAMLSYIHEEKKLFTVADVLDSVKEKLIRRHPHVFGKVKVKDSAEVLDNWEDIKRNQEGKKPKDSILDEVSQGIPVMDMSYKLQKKAAKAGFDWQDVEGVIAKICEELEEVRKELTQSAQSTQSNTEINKKFKEKPLRISVSSALNEKLEEELGDLLFSVINLCRFLKVDPSIALRRTNSKFVKRFKYVEKKMKETGQEMIKENLSVMDKYWIENKGVENGS